MSENIIVDEQTTTQDVETTETKEGVATNSNEEVVSKAEYNKLIAEKEKREGRYKSTMKKQTTEAQKVEVKESSTDIDAIVDRKLAKIKEEEAFIREHWEWALDNVTSVLDKYPDLSLEDAYKLSATGQDPATTADPTKATIVWTSWALNTSDSKITKEQLFSLPDDEYVVQMNKVDRGELFIVD